MPLTRSAAVVRWLARVCGTVLFYLQYRQSIYEVNRLIVQKWAYAERIFSIALLGMLVGLIVGWWNHRFAAALLMSGYILAAGMPFVGGFTRPMIGSTPQDIAVALLPFLVLGLAYAYSGRRWSTLI
jgi:hypothetical protein